MFRIVIIAFMDAWNFDVRSAKKCCVHHILPNGDIMPFCSYNTIHRPKYMTKTRERALAIHASRDGDAPVTQAEVTSAVQAD